MISQEQVNEICRRSAAGEGVINILKSMDIDEVTGLHFLRKHHVAEIEAAKRTQLGQKREPA